MKLSFQGATEEVTGSCFLLETSQGHKILIDCGMKQGERMCILRTLDEFTFSPANLTAVLVTHAHFDHTGRLPELTAKGYRGPIFCTPPTKALTEIILNDSLNIMTENAERCGDPVPFGEEDLKQAISQMQGINYHTAIEIAPGVTAMFHDAGHILGSSFISIEEAGKRIVFSGDIGNDDIPILPETEALHRADVVVCETTYGDREHEPAEERGRKLESFINRVVARRGTVLIPAFSVERTQELLYELDKLLEAKKIPRVPIYLDSPLAIRATELYRHFKHFLQFNPGYNPDQDFFSFTGLHETMAKEASMAINEDHRPKIIVAGNGMMTGGRIMHHLKRYVEDEKSGLLVIGFQAPGTLGRKILNREPRVRIYREELEVRIEVEQIGAFSAHGDRIKLAKWLHPTEGTLQKVFLVHGEDESKNSFKDYAVSKGVTGEIHIPRLHETFEV